jgi:hypothetical protein
MKDIELNRVLNESNDPWNVGEEPSVRKWEREVIESLLFAMDADDWDGVHAIINAAAKKRLKDRISPALETRWGEVWSEVSYEMQLTGVDWEQWKKATILWFRKAYEKEHVEEVVNIKSGAPEAIAVWWENTQSMGKYFDWEALKKPKNEIEIKAWDNQWFRKTRKWVALPNLSDEEVWAKALHEERDDDYLPWQGFIRSAIQQDGNAEGSEKALNFWRKELLKLPLIKHRHGGLRAAWQIEGISGRGLSRLKYQTQWINRPNQKDLPLEHVVEFLRGIGSFDYSVNLGVLENKREILNYLALLLDRPDMWLKESRERRERNTYAKLSAMGYYSIEEWAVAHHDKWILLCSQSKYALEHHDVPFFVGMVLQFAKDSVAWTIQKNLESEIKLWLGHCTKWLLSEFSSKTSIEFREQLERKEVWQAYRKMLKEPGLLECVIQNIDAASVTQWCQYFEATGIITTKELEDISALALNRSFKVVGAHKRRAVL